MELIEQIIAIVSACVPLFIAALTFLIKFIKNGKANKILSRTLQITEMLQPLIIEAERFMHYTGEEKKQYVLTKANQFAIENNILFDMEKVSALIDGIVETTKRVNSREKDKYIEQSERVGTI